MFFLRSLPVVTLVACGSSALVDSAPVPDRPELRSCSGGSVDPVAQGEFEHLHNELTAAIGWPRHIAEDTLSTDRDWISLHAKFAYGAAFDDLEDEEVEVWVGNCQGGVDFMGLGITDDDGLLDVGLDPSAIDGYGDFTVFYRVVGDGSVVTASLRKLPEGTHLQVFDIDGTLTTSDGELFRDLFSELGSGGYVPSEREGSVETVWTRYDQRYEIVYLTGRPYWLDGITQQWLDALSFPPGTLHLARSNTEILPLDSSVGDYKADYLSGLQELGFVIDFAYGNASTDIYGYANAGISPDDTLILGPEGGGGGTIAGGEDYLEHLAGIAGEAPISQPFDR